MVDTDRSAFPIVCSEKSVRNSSDQKLERAFQSLSLKRHLETLRAHVPDADTAYLPGAGALFQGNCSHAVIDGRWLGIFAGCVAASLLSVPNPTAVCAMMCSTCGH